MVNTCKVCVKYLARCGAQEKVLPEEVELSNRVVREWVQGGQLSGEDFLRVTFGDEDGGQLYMGYGTDADAEWWKHMRQVLREGKHSLCNAGWAFKIGCMFFCERSGSADAEKPPLCGASQLYITVVVQVREARGQGRSSTGKLLSGTLASIR
jgi:hypothetical protein